MQEDRLLISDPKALQYIFHTSGAYLLHKARAYCILPEGLTPMCASRLQLLEMA